MTKKNFGEVVEFLDRYVDTIVLGDEGGAQIVIVPQFQGRTMTSTSRGSSGTSYGWVNFDQIASEEKDPQVNLYGGEDRFWISPEGGQFSVFFDPDVPMDLAHWRTPEIIDTSAFEVVEQQDDRVRLSKKGKMVNFSRFEFHLQFDREVVLLSPKEVSEDLGVSVDGLAMVSHESRNSLTNIGDQAWRPETGLIGIWILNMNIPSPKATVIIPFMEGDPEELGQIVNADYFGQLDSSRLVVDEANGLIYFLGDGQLRSKLGLTFDRALSLLGSWDPVLGVLTVTQFNLPDSAPHGYNNNLWEIQDDPYGGDVINSYNDGPNETGGTLGPFFELETISPALALKPNESYTHIHRTIRMEGDFERLNEIAMQVFGVTLHEVESQFCRQKV